MAWCALGAVEPYYRTIGVKPRIRLDSTPVKRLKETLVAVSFTARLRGTTPTEPAYIEVPHFVMRRLNWGRFVRVLARINDKHEMPATIMNVGWGPSFLVPAYRHAGLELNAPVSISLIER